MSTVPPGPPPPPPAPIEPAPARRGCARTGLIGCGAAALLVVLCLVGLMIYLQRRPATVTDFMMKQIEANYAADVTEQEKQDLRAAYASFRVALAQDRARPESMDRVRRILGFAPGRSEVTRDQVRELTEAFREGVREGPAGPGTSRRPTLAPEPEATPSP